MHLLTNPPVVLIPTAGRIPKLLLLKWNPRLGGGRECAHKEQTRNKSRWRPWAFESHVHPKGVWLKGWLAIEGGTRTCLLSALSQIPALQINIKTLLLTNFLFLPTHPSPRLLGQEENKHTSWHSYWFLIPLLLFLPIWDHLPTLLLCFGWILTGLKVPSKRNFVTLPRDDFL